MPTRAFTLLLVLLAAACVAQPHSVLQAPPRAAPAPQRLDAYQRLHPETASEAFLVLGDGTVVYHPEDLLPVVEPGSETARAARRSGGFDRASWPWLVAGALVGAAGVGLATYGSVVEDDLFLPVLGLGVGLVGTGVAAFPTIYYDARAEAERAAAFAAYDRDLRERLGLPGAANPATSGRHPGRSPAAPGYCVRGLAVVSCPASRGLAP